MAHKGFNSVLKMKDENGNWVELGKVTSIEFSFKPKPMVPKANSFHSFGHLLRWLELHLISTQNPRAN